MAFPMWEDSQESVQTFGSPEDLGERLQRSRHRSALLESERDYYRQMYEKAVEQKEEVRKKAKDAVRLMRAIYKDYEELQGILRNKEHVIQDLKAAVATLENKARGSALAAELGLDTAASSGPHFHNFAESEACSANGESPVRALFNAFSMQDTPNDERPEELGGNHRTGHRAGSKASEEVFSYTPKRGAASVSSAPMSASRPGSESCSVTPFNHALVEECAQLRARVAELEGLLVGTLYHSARKEVPSRITHKDLEPFSPAKRADHNEAVGRMIEALLGSSGLSNSSIATTTSSAADMDNEENEENEVPLVSSPSQQAGAHG